MEEIYKNLKKQGIITKEVCGAYEEFRKNPKMKHNKKSMEEAFTALYYAQMAVKPHEIWLDVDEVIYSHYTFSIMADGEIYENEVEASEIVGKIKELVGCLVMHQIYADNGIDDSCL